MNIDIFQIPLYYISFKKNLDIEAMYTTKGFKNVNYFQAVNGKDLNPLQLYFERKLGMRAYNEIINRERKEWWGMPGMGAIGCSLSHYTIWNICVQNNLNYIVVAEDDNEFTKPLNISTIQDTLAASKSIFFGIEPGKFGSGSHFYIISRSLCADLIEYFFPIEVQVDSYIVNYCRLAPDVVIRGEDVTTQTRSGANSSIQDICIPCLLPGSNGFYIILAAVLLFCLVGTIVAIISLRRRATKS